WVCFPESGQSLCTLALIYDIANDAFGVRELPEVTCAAVGTVNDEAVSEAWDDDNEAWDADNSPWNEANYSLAVESLLIGCEDVAEMQDTQDAVALAAHVSRYDLTFGAPERVKFVRRVHVRTRDSSGTLYVRVGGRMSPTDTIAWSAEVPLAAPEQLVNIMALGRYISVEIRSDGDDVWSISGIDIEAEMRGYH